MNPQCPVKPRAHTQIVNHVVFFNSPRNRSAKRGESLDRFRAACHSSGVVLSSVLAAMGVAAGDARGTVRFSLGRGTTESEVDAAVAAVAEAAGRLRS